MPRYYRKPRSTLARRGRFRKRGTSWYNKRYSPMQMARAAWKGVKYIRNLINVEHQKFDTSVVAFTGISTTPTVTHVSAIAVGDSEGNRTGNSVLTKYLYLKNTFILNDSANVTRIRLAVILDNQQVADTPPTYLDVYKSVDPQALINSNTVGRYTILMDRLIDLDTANNRQICFDKYIRLNHHIRFNGNTGADIQKGGLYVMLVSDQATNTPSCNVQARLMYIDN